MNAALMELLGWVLVVGFIIWFCRKAILAVMGYVGRIVQFMHENQWLSKPLIGLCRIAWFLLLLAASVAFAAASLVILGVLWILAAALYGLGKWRGSHKTESIGDRCMLTFATAMRWVLEKCFAWLL